MNANISAPPKIMKAIPRIIRFAIMETESRLVHIFGRT